MRKLREFDCGTWERGTRFGRVTVKENADGTYAIILVSYTRPRLTKTEELIDVLKTLSDARERAWELSSKMNQREVNLWQ